MICSGQRSHDLVISSLRHYAVMCACWVFLSLAQDRKECLCKIHCNYLFCQLSVFHIYLIQIYFESKYSKKLWFLDSNTQGFESIRFDIPLYASLAKTPSDKSRNKSSHKVMQQTTFSLRYHLVFTNDPPMRTGDSNASYDNGCMRVLHCRCH